MASTEYAESTNVDGDPPSHKPSRIVGSLPRGFVIPAHSGRLVTSSTAVQAYRRHGKEFQIWYSIRTKDSSERGSSASAPCTSNVTRASLGQSAAGGPVSTVKENAEEPASAMRETSVTTPSSTLGGGLRKVAASSPPERLAQSRTGCPCFFTWNATLPFVAMQ